MEKIISGTPLDMGKLISLTGHDALATIGNYKVRIMNYSEGQTVEVDDIVEWGGYLWGIRKMKNPKPQYGYIAFRAVR